MFYIALAAPLVFRSGSQLQREGRLSASAYRHGADTVLLNEPLIDGNGLVLAPTPVPVPRLQITRKGLGKTSVDAGAVQG